MSKRGLPAGISMRHDSHYVEEFSRTHKSIGKILPITQIEPNPDQPRTEIGDLSELTSSIKQNGILEPILVKPNSKTGNWMIIAGERRWRAANLAGLTEVPCIEFDLDDKAIAEIALIENLQRKDLTIWEEADGLAALNRTFGYTHDEIAKKISKSRSTVTESFAIARIPEDIRQRCREADINAKSILLEIARQFDDTEMHKFIDKINSRKMNREEIRVTARPATAVKSNKKSGEQKVGSYGNFNENLSNKTFEFVSHDDNFKLYIEFSDNNFNKNTVLKALKETFEKVKKQSE
ncbi:MAG: ParB/RepB/Spo0J family partition protein [Pyrinomonadaceae bacterium]|nr:ParB/RepB/Spo0J family partition protein [Pyrinomonadaceae bacterium]